jgi:hypothetical protein
MIKPELRTSEKVASWPLEVRYFWVLLWGYVDDYGRGKDQSKLIKADCFPLDEDITSDVIDGWLWILSDAGVIVRYEIDGVQYLAIKNWSEHQTPHHPGKDIFPSFTNQNVLIRTTAETFMQPLGESLETVGRVSGESRESLPHELSRDEESRVATDGGRETYSDEFETWWNEYPRKVAKGTALKAWKGAISKTSFDVLLDSVKAYAVKVANIEQQYILHAATWLNGERWNDEPEPVRHDPDAWMNQVVKWGPERYE